MKKAVVLYLTIALAVLLMACGGANNQTMSSVESSTDQQSNDTSVTSEATPEATSEDNTTEETKEKIEVGKSASIKKGKYVGGKDIPAGFYVLEKKENESGIVSLSSPEDDLDTQYPSKIYEFIGKDDQASFFISLETGGILDVPFLCELTSVDYSEMNVNDEIVAVAGMYIGGLDVPAGNYILSYDETHEGSGIVWLSDIEDDLSSEYPSKIYEFIGNGDPGTWYVSLDEGDKLYLPFTCNSLTRINPINFDEDSVVLHAGMYICGEDIPAGNYNIVCTANSSNSGIAWVSAPGDNLDEGYPSVLYEFIGSNSEETYYISIEEGGKMYLPCDATIESDEGVVFN